MFQLPLQFLRWYAIVSFGVFLGVQSLKHFSWNSPKWVFNHLNDFLLIPLVGTFALHVVWFLKKDTRIRLNAFTIFSLVLLFSIVFEWYLPKQSFRYTADVYDVLAYTLGGFVFFLLQKMD